VLARNVRLKGGELDLVLRRGRMLVICEVKARQSLAFGEGHEAVDRRKRERLVELGDYYAARMPHLQIRYDILSLRWTGRRFVVQHFEDAFRPEADPREPWKHRVD
jgi:Holliday junction resolvase-like predicted endonuclease